MCGIVAVLKFGDTRVDENVLTRMRDAMYHRGPDDAGLHLDGPVGLGHRRLSILDLSPAGHQPMCNEDGSLWLVFNGEIYNYVELAADLRRRGHRFRSQTDSEVILHLYEELGEHCVDELNGMFAFAIWDARQRLLFGARDRLGIKPFHYYLDERQFVCASEIKAILEDPLVRRAPDHRGIADYLFAGAPLAGKTFYAGISELPPGHVILVRDGRATIRQFWDVRYDYRHHASAAALVDGLEALLDHSVKIQCRSDVPLGCHLSGGLDSSTVTSLAAHHLDRLKTFSIRFGEGSFYDETRYARMVADAVGADYVELTATQSELARLYPALLWHMDQPSAGGGDAGFSYYAAAYLAAQHVTVTLTGHGGDEIFAGYPAQFQAAFGNAGGFDLSTRPHTRPSALARLRRVHGVEGLPGLVRRLVRRLTDPAESGPGDLWVRLHCGPEPRRNPFLHSRFLDALAGYTPREDYLRPFAAPDTPEVLDRCLYHDLRVYLPQLLHKEDRASMAVSIESRLPLLDHRIVELMATVPPEQKVPQRLPKALLRTLAARRLPAEVVERRDKVPFAVPMHEWARGALQPLIREVVYAPQCLERGIFNPDAIRHGHVRPEQLIALLNVELWFRIYIDRDASWNERAGIIRAEQQGGRVRPTSEQRAAVR
jgi:asparagine synthase (glutamine-hydrolysing)